MYSTRTFSTLIQNIIQYDPFAPKLLAHVCFGNPLPVYAWFFEVFRSMPFQESTSDFLLHFEKKQQVSNSKRVQAQKFIGFRSGDEIGQTSLL